MNQFIPTYTDISDWEKIEYTSTGGTRSKKIVIQPSNQKEFFFKGSKVIQETGEIRYPNEFWSEIISSKIGQYLGFNMLDYNIGYMDSDYQKIGCLSASMVEHSQNKLTEGVSYLTGFDSSYRPTLAEHKKHYTFQFICNALDYFSLKKHIESIIEIIVFDAIVSNSDRHQENWGIITFFKETIDRIDEELNRGNVSFGRRIGIKFAKWITKSASLSHELFKKLPKSTLLFQHEVAPVKFAPIYDSGCCLGRELEDTRVNVLLEDNKQLEKYIDGGVSEIHWTDKKGKIDHFTLVRLVKAQEPDYAKLINKRINDIKLKYDKNKLRSLIFEIDSELPINLHQFRLPNNRKQLIYKIVTLRLERLFSLG
ncbi:MAG: hypothetical protein JNM67_01830 [Bacteroidetes bacterium]|nr:hypothetical protein [Bacteroidota bacterium]